MTKFRKKPIIVDAIQFGIPVLSSKASLSRSDAWKWVRGHLGPGQQVSAGTDEKGHFLLIETLEGMRRADEGDFIIQGPRGEIYPCKSEIFWATYEAVV